MPRASGEPSSGGWGKVAAVLTVVLLAVGIGALLRTEGAKPVAPAADDALPSRALGLSDHRRLVRQLEESGEHRPGQGARSPRTAAGPLRGVTHPLRPAAPLRLRIPGLGIDVPLAADGHGEASWDEASPAPGAEGTAVISGSGLRLAGLQRGRTIEIPRADSRTAVFTVVRISPGEATGREDRAGRAQLRLVGGETAVLARLTGQRRGR
ncbi:class F sortase [Streptomyces sp. ISL-94]|uniref:class F sortase n=1 Tax=Streptomyces sp. ISL-94 TaxID=2819190 RepID=UPI001BE63BDA|nr:class F sortase [Streptomyces sp. ISL-94]MBT2479639.1 class F sortase [Streptomyces sp. ISL-94]